MMGIREIRDDLTFATEAPTDNGDAEEKPLYNVLGDEESLYQTRQRTDTERYPHLDVLKKNSMKDSSEDSFWQAVFQNEAYKHERRCQQGICTSCHDFVS